MNDGLFESYRADILQDLTRIKHAWVNPLNVNHDNVKNEVARWLSPIIESGTTIRHPYVPAGHNVNATYATEFSSALDKLMVAFKAGDENTVCDWSISGSYRGRRGLLALAFAHSSINKGDGVYQYIRINRKFSCLPTLVRKGVMVHEATHATLGTRDFKYEKGAGGYFDVLKDGLRVWKSENRNLPLSNVNNTFTSDLHYANADNWRLFYQKMWHHLH